MAHNEQGQDQCPSDQPIPAAEKGDVLPRRDDRLDMEFAASRPFVACRAWRN